MTKIKMPIGGQALPNGVMIHSPYKTTVVLCHRSGHMLTTSWTHIYKRTKKKPVLRGIYQLFVSLKESLRTVREAVKLSKSAGKIRVSPMSILSAVAAIGLLVLYVFASDWAYNELNLLLPEYRQHYLLTFLYGIVDIIFFTVVLYVITHLPTVRKMLRYHGAEHKAIVCYEKGLEMTVENVRQQSRYHKRCGTSMVVTILMVGVIVPAFIPPALADIWQELILAISVLLAVGIAYEGMRSGRKSFVTRLGMAAQRITTKEPDDAMIKCAVKAIDEACHI